MFAIKADRSSNSIRMTFDSLFWDAEIVERFRAETAQAVASLRCQPGTHVVLIDLRDAILQSQDTITAAKKMIGDSVARKIALVAQSALARMQTKRLQIRENVVLFERMEDAEAWLFEAEASAAA